MVAAIREQRSVPSWLLQASDDPPRERVLRGAKLLDSHRPGWVTDIDVRRLNMRTPWCVLGQLYGSYINGHCALGLGPAIWLEGAYHGFLESDARVADELGNQWRLACHSNSSGLR